MKIIALLLLVLSPLVSAQKPMTLEAAYKAAGIVRLNWETYPGAVTEELKDFEYFVLEESVIADISHEYLDFVRAAAAEVDYAPEKRSQIIKALSDIEAGSLELAVLGRETQARAKELMTRCVGVVFGNVPPAKPTKVARALRHARLKSINDHAIVLRASIAAAYVTAEISPTAKAREATRAGLAEFDAAFAELKTVALLGSDMNEFVLQILTVASTAAPEWKARLRAVFISCDPTFDLFQAERTRVTARFAAAAKRIDAK